MLSLKFTKLKLHFENSTLEAIGWFHIFLLKALKENLLKQDICDITLFSEYMIDKEFELLEERGLFNNGITEKGVEIVDLFDIVTNLNQNFSIVTDNYLYDLFLYDEDKLSLNKNYQFYPPKIFDYQLLKKVNKDKDKILLSLNNEIINKYIDEFNIKIFFQQNYYFNLTDFKVKDEGEYFVEVPAIKITYDIKSKYNNCDIKQYFKTFYYDLYNGEKLDFINSSYKKSVTLQERFELKDIEFEDTPIPFNKLALCDIKVNTEKIKHIKYIDLVSILKGI